jgi:ABC-type antimicrobial peptide transport system permease subunit
VKVFKTLRTALRALRRNVTRSALTILGIVIGIAAVIIMMEIGQGSKGAIAKSIASMGANNLLIMPGTAASGGVTFGAGSVLTLTAEDCDAVVRECDAVASAAPVVRARTQIIYQDRNWVPSFIYGTTPEYLTVRDWAQTLSGDVFTEADVRSGSRVCMVGTTIVRELFGGADPVGKELRVNNVGLRVIGVLGPKGANTFGMDQDDVILAPWTTIKYRVQGTGTNVAGQSTATTSGASSSQTTSGTTGIYPGGTGGASGVYPATPEVGLKDRPRAARYANIDQIQAAARSAEEIQAAIRQITAVLRERHRLGPGEPDDFSIRDMTEGANMLSSTTTMMTNLLLGVALISLVVGGVGIMNIMLVSVTERTKEIGLRMAVGARGRDILTQFLAEAIVLCLIGGVLGWSLGRGGSLAVQRFLRWPVEASMEAAIASVAVAAGVGIVFGFYPAFKASRMDPIEALRYE